MFCKFLTLVMLMSRAKQSIQVSIWEHETFNAMGYEYAYLMQILVQHD